MRNTYIQAAAIRKIEEHIEYGVDLHPCPICGTLGVCMIAGNDTHYIECPTHGTHGYPQRQIQESAYNCQREIEEKERIVVGVNSYTIEEPPPEGLLKVDPSVEKAQYAKLRDVREKRDNGEVGERLRALAGAAEGPDNLMPFILDAVRVYATLGEICGVMREKFGEYTPQTVL